MSNPTLLGLAAGLVLATNASSAIINVPADQPTIQAAILGQELGCHRRLRSEGSDWNLGLGAGALYSCSGSSAVEPGEGQMEMSA